MFILRKPSGSLLLPRRFMGAVRAGNLFEHENTRNELTARGRQNVSIERHGWTMSKLSQITNPCKNGSFAHRKFQGELECARDEKFPEFPEHLTPGRSSVPRTAPNRFEKGQGGLCSEFVEVVKLIILQSKLQSATKYYPLLPGIPLRTTKSDNALRLTAQMETHKSSCARGAISF